MHCHPQSAFELPWCNDHVDSSNGLYLIVTSLHEDDSVPFPEEAALGKGYQIEF
jgi:hypothetical protein